MLFRNKIYKIIVIGLCSIQGMFYGMHKRIFPTPRWIPKNSYLCKACFKPLAFDAISIKKYTNQIDCSEKGNIEIFFPSADKNMLKIFLDLINQEQKAIFFAAYTLTHVGVIDALKKAVERGIKVEGVVDINTIDNFKQREWVGSEVIKHRNIVTRFLKDYNIAVYDRHKKCMHNKLFLFENNGIYRESKLLAGSANPSNAGLNAICDKKKNEDYSHNPETVVLLTSRPREWELCKDEIEYLIKRAREK